MSTRSPSKPTAQSIVKMLRAAPFEELESLTARFISDPRTQVCAAVKSAQKRYARELAERERVLGMYAFQASLSGGGIALGVDEVGRGSLAGPLTVAAIVLPSEPIMWGLNDSKQLSAKQRELIASQIAELAPAIGLAFVDANTIDELGMAASLRLAMSQAIIDAGATPDVVLIDGNPVHVHEREQCIIKGDTKVAAIAAASIVAKVARDNLMRHYDAMYPGYHLASCKGYGSAAHIAAIKQLGLTPIHRRSFCDHFLNTKGLF